MVVAQAPPSFPQEWLKEAGVVLSNVIPLARKVRPPQVNATDQLKKNWEEIKRNDAKAPAVMTDILAMTGLTEVKEEFVKQYNRIKVSQRRGDGPAGSYNARFEGNPGTGKTTIAGAFNQN